MSTDSIALPTVISTSAILNAVVRSVETAVKSLGSEYFSVAENSYGNIKLFVHRVAPDRSFDPLDTAQAAVKGTHSIWSVELGDRAISSDGKSSIPYFKSNPAQFFFLSEEAALSYIESVEKGFSEEVIAAINSSTSTKEAN